MTIVLVVIQIKKRNNFLCFHQCFVTRNCCSFNFISKRFSSATKMYIVKEYLANKIVYNLVWLFYLINQIRNFFYQIVTVQVDTSVVFSWNKKVVENVNTVSFRIKINCVPYSKFSRNSTIS